MKIDVFSIFPEYLAPLKLSLLGKAQSAGIVDIAIHDLRAFTHDNHNTVDDTPYGGGAGMVMLPEVWGSAIDSVLDDNSEIIILTPAGKTFHQTMAQEFSLNTHLIFACGRYEGIDHRVTEFYQGVENVRVHEISIGDYVLNGGEVAALVMMEAIIRLLPGVIGNPDSLVEESHTLNDEGQAIVEYPNYTKPASWRGLEVPSILMSGNHGAIAQYRLEEAKKRTQTRE